MRNKMKTSVTMVRPMGAFEVKQRTKDGMFNATDLLRQWNKHPNNPKRKLSKFWELKQTKEFLEVLAQDKDFLDSPKKGYLKTHETTRGKNAGTFMHPFLFIKFAMWLNPKFELEVIKFVADKLIDFRHEAGVGYKELGSALKSLKGIPNYTKIAKALNYIVFGKHRKDIRNTANTIQLKELSKTQSELATMIGLDIIKTQDELISMMRRMYDKKYNIIK